MEGGYYVQNHGTIERQRERERERSSEQTIGTRSPKNHWDHGEEKEGTGMREKGKLILFSKREHLDLGGPIDGGARGRERKCGTVRSPGFLLQIFSGPVFASNIIFLRPSSTECRGRGPRGS